MQQINPAPVPSIWGFDHTPDGQYVVVILNTHQGQAVHFILGETGEGFIAALTDQVQKAAAIREEAATQHIEVPPQVMFGPDGNPMRVVPPVVETESRPEQTPEDKLLHAIFDGERPASDGSEPKLQLIDGTGDES